MINQGRMTAKMDDGFVVFMIGMRLNQPILAHKWLPVFLEMPKMLKELYQQSELGFLSHEIWFSRNTILVQYWRSLDHLLAYAKANDSAHLPAWQRFNRLVASGQSVGIWHETYSAAAGTYENVYVNMPKFGLAKVAELKAARGDLKTASKRLGL